MCFGFIGFVYGVKRHRKSCGEKFGYEIDDGYAFFVLSADIDDDKRKYTDVLLESMFLFFKDLSAQYPQNVNITELEV